MTILYTLYKNTYIDLSHLDSTKGVTCYVNTTNRCPCACTFCLRQTKRDDGKQFFMVEGRTF